MKPVYKNVELMARARRAAEADLAYYREMMGTPVRDKELGKKHLAGDFGPDNCNVYFKPLSDDMLLVEWSVDHVGFGQLYLHIKDGKLVKVDSETMQKPFIKALFAAAIEAAELDD